MQAIRDIFPSDAPAVPIGAVKSEQCALATPTKSNKLEIKLQAMLVQPSALLKRFVGDEWDDIKESNVTTYIAKLHSVHDEASHAGFGDAMDKASVWLVGLGAAKQFIRTHREWRKSNGKSTGKFMEMLEPLAKLSKFLEESVDIIPAASLGLMLLKLQFFKQVVVVPPIP